MGDSAALSLTLLHSLGLYVVVWEEEVVVYLCIFPASRSLPTVGSSDWFGLANLAG